MSRCLILLLFIQNVATFTMPVVVIDPIATLKSGLVSANPFNEMTSNAFTEIVHDAVHLTESILIFVEDNLSVEDITSKDAKGTPYTHVHQSFLEEKAKYMPSVVEPFKTLQQLLPPHASNVVVVTDSIKPFAKGSKYHYLYFTEYMNSSRVEMLRRHDQLMKDAYDKLSQELKGPIILFYTGKNNPMLRLGFDYSRPPARDLANTIMKVNGQALIRLSGVVLQQGALRTTHFMPSVTAQTFARRRLSTRMMYSEFQLDFNFEYLPDGWLLDSVVLLEGGEEVGRTPMGVGAPYDWSYYCSEPLMIVNTRDKSYVTISKYQVEPLRAKPKSKAFQDEVPESAPVPATEGAADAAATPAPGADSAASAEDSSKTTFTNTMNCGTNFNCRILAGLFVVSIVISITFGGIMVMYDCKSNDQMDDPNQKPLVIVAQL